MLLRRQHHRLSTKVAGSVLLWAVSLIACEVGTCACRSEVVVPSEGSTAAACHGNKLEHRPMAPHVTPALETAHYWLARMPKAQRERVLLPATQLPQPTATARLDAKHPVELGWSTETELADHGQRANLERRRYYEDRFSQGTLFAGVPGAWQTAKSVIDRAQPRFGKRGLLRDTSLLCTPSTAGYYDDEARAGFDRNQCSVLYAGSWVYELAADEASQWSFVAADQGFGWVEAAALGGMVTAENAWSANGFAYVTKERIFIDPPENTLSLRVGTKLPANSTDMAQVVVPSSNGWRFAQLPNRDDVSRGPLSLTYERLFELAFARIGEPYAWGGSPGLGRDCSRFILDILTPFGLEFPRNSAEQSLAGSSFLDVEGRSDQEKLLLMRRHSRDHVVILYMPGHIMLYLGSTTDERGLERDYAISAISEFVEPCPAGHAQEHIIKLDRTAVTTLELGRNTSRRAFIERISRIVLLGAPVADP